MQKDLLLNTNILEYNQLAASYVSDVYYKETWTLKHVANLCAFMNSMAFADLCESNCSQSKSDCECLETGCLSNLLKSGNHGYFQ